MSNGKERKECGCEHLKTDPRKVARFTDKTRVEEIVRYIPLLFRDKAFVKVVQLAVLLPQRRETEEILKSNTAAFSLDISEIKAEHAKNLYDTAIAIGASHALLIRSWPYKQEASLIEDLAKLTPLTEEGEEYWEKELLNALLKDEDLNKSIEIWSKNLASIKKLTELFHLPPEKVKGICKKAINESKETEPSKCISVAKEMDIPISPKEYQEIADKIMGAANEDGNEDSRHKKAYEACSVYKALREYSYFNREKILREGEKYKLQKAIKKASEILGFKYIGRFWQEAGSC